MKRLVLLSLCVLAFLGTACARMAEEDTPAGYGLYYREAELSAAAGGNALRAEYVTFDDAEDCSTQELAERLLKRFLKGPEDPTLTSVVPSGTTLLSVAVDGGRAMVDLSLPYNMLSGVELTLADYAITLTLSQLPEVLTTSITVHGQRLAYRDRQTFTAWDILYATHEDVVSTLNVTLYFPDEDGVLQPERRTLDLYEGDTQAETVAAALLAGPDREELLPVLPEGWEKINVWVKETTCYVNLSTALLTENTTEEEIRLALDALGRSLCGLDTVKEVRFLVDGTFGQYYGPVDVSAAYAE